MKSKNKIKQEIAPKEVKDMGEILNIRKRIAGEKGMKLNRKADKARIILALIEQFNRFENLEECISFYLSFKYKMTCDQIQDQWEKSEIEGYDGGYYNLYGIAHAFEQALKKTF